MNLLRARWWSHDFWLFGVEAFHPGAVVEPLLSRGLARGAAALIFPIEVDADAIDLVPAIGALGGLEGVDESGADDASHHGGITAAHDLAGILHLDESFFLYAFAGAKGGLILWRCGANELGRCRWQA